MAQGPSDDQLRKARPDDPALAVACKRITVLEADIINLRRSMAQQLTSSGKLLKAVFALDNDYFGGRFQGQQAPAGTVDPFRDLNIATQVVEAVAEELQGAGAFADSPVLRDGLGTLVAALESVRDLALEIEKTGIAAVGLPVKPEGFKARTFPENNPPACLAEVAGFMRDLSGFILRARDRFGAMRMMIMEAESAREGDAAVPPVGFEKLNVAITAELHAVEADLATIRAQFAIEQEKHETAIKHLRAELESARRDTAVEAEQRRADRAEMRSLGAEIARLVGAAMAPGDSDDLEITLSVLREALTEDHDVAAVAAATEGVVVDWIRLATARASAAQEDLHKLRVQLASAGPGTTPGAGESALRAGLEQAMKAREEALRQAEANLKKTQILALEAEASRGRLAEAERQVRRGGEEAAALKLQLAAAIKDAQALQAQVRTATAAGEGAGALKLQLAAAIKDTQQLQAQARAAAPGGEGAGALKARMAEALKTIQQRDDELKRLREAQGQDQRRATAGSEEAAALKAKMAEALKTIQQREEAQAQELRQAAAVAGEEATALKAKMAEALKTIQQRDDELKRLRDAQVRELGQRDEARRQAEAEAKAREAALLAERDGARRSLIAAEARLAQAAASAETAGSEVVRLRTEVNRIAAEQVKAAANLDAATARERQLAGERDRLAQEGGELKARLESLRQERATTVGQAEQSQAALKRTLAGTKAVEAEIKNQLLRANAEATTFGQRTGQLEKELAALRLERDRLGAASQQLAQEREKLRQRLTEVEQERGQSHEAAAKHQGSARTLAQEVERLRQVGADADQRTQRLTAELDQLRERLAATQVGREQASAQALAGRETEGRLLAERDAARAAAAAVSAERDRLKAGLERSQKDHDALALRLEEREAQLTTRLAEVSRQLGELKQTNLRLAAEGERRQAELARASAAPRPAADPLERKENTGVWTKRLADSHAVVEEARARAQAFERKAEEQRQAIAECEERLARQSQAGIHLQERLGELEHQEATLRQSLDASLSAAERHRQRLTTVEQELASERMRLRDSEANRLRQREKFESLMRQAREAVALAKQRQDEADQDDRGIIADLMKQVQELRVRTGTK